MAILTFEQVLITSSKLLCRSRQFWKKCQKLKEKKNIFWKKWRKIFVGWNFLFWSSSVEDDLWKMTWQIISLPSTSLILVLPQYNFYFYSSKLQLLNLSLLQTSYILIHINIHMWQSYLLSCAFGQLIIKRFQFSCY